MSMKSVLLVGSTGSFGPHVARALMVRGVNPRLLVRSGSQHKLDADLAHMCEVTTDRATAFDGVESVISAVQGGPDVIIDAQLELFCSARDAGVRRFIPSDFSLNLFGLDEGENVNSDWRREFARRAEREQGSVELVHVLQGCFLDQRVLFGFLGGIDLATRTAHLWGDGSKKMQFTTYVDTAAYTAEAAIDDRSVPSQLFVAGDSLTFHELVDEIAVGLGAPMSIVTDGTLDDLDAEIARRLAVAPQNPQGWLPLMYWRGMLSGKGALGTLMNDRYPAIHPVNVRDYVATLATRVTA
jgi:nucleoside-diphosphate-sugar epimerase